MNTNITPNCSWCGKHAPSGTATVLAVAVESDECVEMRAVSRGGIAPTGPVAEDFNGAAKLLGEPTITDAAAHIWTDEDHDPNMVLIDLGEVWHAAREAERMAAAAVYAAIRHATEQGVPETRIANLVGVDRMTVRRALGKR